MNKFEYLGSAKLKHTFYHDYDLDFLTRESPKSLNYLYEKDKDYSIVIVAKAKVHLFYNEEIDTLFYLNSRFTVFMYMEKYTQDDYEDDILKSELIKNLKEKEITKCICEIKDFIRSWGD